MTTIGEKLDLNIQTYVFLTCKTDVGHHKVYYYISPRWSEFCTHHLLLTLSLRDDFKGRKTHGQSDFSVKTLQSSACAWNLNHQHGHFMCL